MRVLSLFDGISVGRVALQRAGIRIDEYYASEIDKNAIAVAKYNFPDTKFIGDVRNIDGNKFKGIDLLIGGSPCQNFSFIGLKQGMITKTQIEVTTLEQYLKLKSEGFEFDGQSYLFWEYVRILREAQPKWFLLENVRMAKKWKKVISDTLGVKPVMINSALVSAQNRRRLYWTNIPISGLPEDKGIIIKDILEDEVDEKYFINKPFKYLPEKPGFIIDPYNKRNVENGKATTLRTNYSNGNCWINERFKENSASNLRKLKIRKLTPLECERLQTLPDNYTRFGNFDGKIKKISKTQRYKMIGNAWTADVLAWIFSHLTKKQ